MDCGVNAAAGRVIFFVCLCDGDDDTDCMTEPRYRLLLCRRRRAEGQALRFTSLTSCRASTSTAVPVTNRQLRHQRHKRPPNHHNPNLQLHPTRILRRKPHQDPKRNLHERQHTRHHHPPPRHLHRNRHHAQHPLLLPSICLAPPRSRPSPRHAVPLQRSRR